MRDTLKNIISTLASNRADIRENNQTLEGALLNLTQYGKPGLSLMGRGWHCRVEMYVSSKGVDFKIDSDFDCPTPISAVMQCAERLDKALKDLGL